MVFKIVVKDNNHNIRSSRGGTVNEFQSAQADVQKLIEEALQQPGVADVMKAYQQLKPITDLFSAYSRALEHKWIISGSTRSHLQQ